MAMEEKTIEIIKSFLPGYIFFDFFDIDSRTSFLLEEKGFKNTKSYKRLSFNTLSFIPDKDLHIYRHSYDEIVLNKNIIDIKGPTKIFKSFTKSTISKLNKLVLIEGKYFNFSQIGIEDIFAGNKLEKIFALWVMKKAQLNSKIIPDVLKSLQSEGVCCFVFNNNLYIKE